MAEAATRLGLQSARCQTSPWSPVSRRCVAHILLGFFCPCDAIADHRHTRFFTIGAVLLLSVAHFRQMLANPKDRFHIDNILNDGKAATTVAAEKLPAGVAVPLKTRLDSSIASQHPADPGAPMVKADRLTAFDRAKASQ